MVNQHSKMVTKPKIELQPHLALQQDIFSERAFLFKDFGPIIFKMAPQEPL